MASIKIEDVREKLEHLVNWHARNLKKSPSLTTNPHEQLANNSILVPSEERRMRSSRDNEMLLIDTVLQQIDVASDYQTYFETRERRTGSDVQAYKSLVMEGCDENPLLASWLDDTIKLKRHSDARRQEFDSLDTFYENRLLPATRFLRPHIRGLPQVDRFRELLWQKTMLGKPLYKVPVAQEQLLEKCEEIILSSNTPEKDILSVQQMYGMIRQEMDITPQPAKLPSFPTQTPYEPQLGSKSEESSNNSQANQAATPSETDQETGNSEGSPARYSQEVVPRQNRPDTSLPKYMEHMENSDRNESDEEENIPDINTSNQTFAENKGEYRLIQELAGIHITPYEPEIGVEQYQRVKQFNRKYSAEIEKTKTTLARIQSSRKTHRYDDTGLEVDLDELLQSQLEQSVTGVMQPRRMFKKEITRPGPAAIALHADMSGSTYGPVLEGIREAYFVLSNALARTQHHVALYVSDNELHVVKCPDEPYTDTVNYRIGAFNGGGGGIYLHATNTAIRHDLNRMGAQRKAVVVLSDFENCGPEQQEKASGYELKQNGILPFYIALGREHADYVEQSAQNLGPHHFTTIDKDNMKILPGEIMRMLSTSGVLV